MHISDKTESSLPLQVTTATLARLVVNTSRRFWYPFAPAISRGLGVPLPAVTSLIAMNQATGLLSPLFGPMSDRRGYRTMMLIGLLLLSLGMVGAGIFPLYAMVALGAFLGGVAKSVYDPALQAFIGERVPFARRGMVIGLMEMSWAGSSLVGIPLVGLLIAHFGWQAPFLVLGGLALLGLVAMRLIIPPSQKKQAPVAGEAGFREKMGLLAGSSAAMAMLGFGFLLGMSNDVVFVVYGAWLESAFGLGLVALGSATTVIGIAELTGETLTATLSDRLGLRRAALIGVTLSTLSYALLPVIGQTLPLALVALFFTFITFEFAIVTVFSYITELMPQARATMLSSFLAMTSLGRMLGALLGGPLWLWSGMVGIGLVAAGLSAIATGLLVWSTRRR
jgi:predicted MFS family arabinose efflux permease